jgi:hypothetical protein
MKNRFSYVVHDLPKLYIISYLILQHIMEVMTGQNICLQKKEKIIIIRKLTNTNINTNTNFLSLYCGDIYRSNFFYR